ncbi:ribbon-helix-helix protein, CopG family [Dactylosporangium roseum]|uniref:Ribbon-helix-helix protein, CopG family n=1 Tax=Dactylosporangium roseum TaxID=47989 RepID=A0ABY5ZBP9_9ACTN|nr:ribbon-helix-helix domain-containing protein [Dactylosporangium roseum]UWZ39461.1 ribbon-helix-helix protein, CopG family [Dactylosporangium roseum]
MSGPDFERMSRDEVVAWFDTSEDVSPLLSAVEPVADGVVSPATDGPMAMISIRLPVAMVEELDGLADAQQARRSDVIREALASYIRERTAPVGPDDAQQALEVLRKVVAGRFDNQAEAA